VTERRSDLLACAALVLLSLALCLPRLSGPLDLRYDGAVYYTSGTSLAQGQGYRLPSEPGAIEAVQYPPLLPAIVAVHQLALGSSDPVIVGRALRATWLILWTGLAVAIYLLARGHLPPGLALLAALIAHLHVHSLYFSEMLFAELPFTLMTVLFFLARRREGMAGQLAAAPFAVCAFLLRSAGIALLVAWVAERMVKRRFGQAALAAAVSLVPFLLWQSYTSRVQASSEYRHPRYEYQRAAYQYANVTYAENIALVDPFQPELGRITPGGMVRRGLRNLAALPVSLGDALSVRRELLESQIRKVDKRVPLLLSPERWAGLALGVLGLLGLSGLAVFLRRGEQGIPLYVAASIGLICLTPWPGQFARYLLPLSPFLSISLLLALSALKGLGRPASWAAAAILLGILAGQTLSLWLVFHRFHHRVGYIGLHGEEVHYRLFFYGRSWPAIDEAIDWVRERARPGDVIATSIPHWTSLRTGGKAVMPPFEPDPAEAERLLDSVPVTWIVVDDLQFLDVSRRYAAPVAESRPDSWRKVYTSRTGEARVYRRAENRGSPSGGPK
jgi:hypothetical protein